MKLISSRTHTYIGITAGVVLLVAPWIFQFDDSTAAKWSAIWVGLFILVNEVMTTSPASPMKVVPMSVHVVVDVATGIFLLATPWIFQFSDLPAHGWLPHVVGGVLVAGYALMTDTSDARAAAGTDGLERLSKRGR